MTKDRQADIQNKMYRMFGSGTQSTTTSTTTSSMGGKPSTKMASMKSIGSDRLQLHNMSTTLDEEEEHDETSDLKPTGSEVSDEEELPGNLASSFEDDPRGDEDLQKEWECCTCTLVNKPVDDCCMACGIPRYSDLYAF
jgi:hypothetical protein